MTPARLLKIKKLLKVVIKHNGNQHKAAKELGVTQQAVSKQLAKEEVNKTFIQIMEKAGLTDDFQAKVLMDGHKATRNGKKDHLVRHKYLETGLKIKKYLGGEVNLNTQVNVAAFLIPEKKPLPTE